MLPVRIGTVVNSVQAQPNRTGNHGSAFDVGRGARRKTPAGKFAFLKYVHNRKDFIYIYRNEIPFAIHIDR